MEKILELISKEVSAAFEAAGYDAELGKVTLSNRPDLCEYQCNGAMAGAKKYGKAPFMIADAVAEKLQGSEIFSSVESVKPGFLNLKVSEDFIRGYIVKMLHEHHFGIKAPLHAPNFMIDYGGPNVAKPLHVGHLRSAVIGESLKRILKYAGYKVTGDIHLGDWGLQMGLIITELKKRQPDLPYFDKNHTGQYPKEAPSQSASLRRYTLLQVLSPRRTRHLRLRLWRQPSFFRMEIRDIVHFGTTSLTYQLTTLRKIIRTLMWTLTSGEVSQMFMM